MGQSIGVTEAANRGVPSAKTPNPLFFGAPSEKTPNPLIIGAAEAANRGVPSEKTPNPFDFGLIAEHRRKMAENSRPAAPAPAPEPQMSQEERDYRAAKQRMAAIPETEEGRRAYLVKEKGSRAGEYGW